MSPLARILLVSAVVCPWASAVECTHGECDETSLVQVKQSVKKGGKSLLSEEEPKKTKDGDDYGYGLGAGVGLRAGAAAAEPLGEELLEEDDKAKGPTVTAQALIKEGYGNSSAVLLAYEKLKIAEANLKALQANRTIAKGAVSATKKNITLFSRQAKKAKNQFTSHRKAAVSFAKKVTLANVSIFKAQEDMHNAYFAETGAEQGAQMHLIKAQNNNAMKRYYEKQLIDANYLVKQARHNVTIGDVAVDKAQSGVSFAKRAVFNKNRTDHKDDAFKRRQADAATDLSMRMSVKQAMEDAYIAGSVARNSNNTPPWGNGAAPLVN